MREKRDFGAFCRREVKDKIKYWILKILLELDGFKSFCDRDGYVFEREILQFLELKGFLQSRIEVDERKLYQACKQEYQRLCNFSKLEGNEDLKVNLTLLQKFFSLSDVEVAVLEFLLYLKQYRLLEDSIGLLTYSRNQNTFTSMLSVLLDVSKNTIEEAVGKYSILKRSAIIQDDNYQGSLEVKNPSFVSKMFGKITKIEELFEESIKLCSKTSLTLKDYNYLREDVSFLHTYLKSVLKKKSEGVNILLYGEAGTGKTELVKTLCKSLKVTLFEVSYVDADGDCIEGNARMGAYRVAQNLLRGRKVLMYDEAEDVLYADDRFLQKGKAWINRSLECNKIPTFWITNKISKVDEAIIRRFDYVLHVPLPPREKRIEVLKKYCPKAINENMLEKIAQNSKISPALLQKASKLVEISNHQESSKLFSRYIQNSLQAMGYSSKAQTLSLPSSYDLSFVNTNMDMQELLNGLKGNPTARMCFYGVAGSGKSAYARYIAQSLGKSCILKKGSDLLDKYVGGSEQRIAQAFEEARNSDGVLVFDEVDSFLREREGASKSWEVTLVNEMLVQMEEFEGIFIATTNLIDTLDKACLRRFDLKLEFDYLSSTQLWGLFLRECENMKLKVDETLKESVKSLSKISAGDFASVRRSARFSPLKNCEDFYQRLFKESQLKNPSRAIGFASNL